LNIIIREFTENDIDTMILIWNEVVDGGIAFPQIDTLSKNEAITFFAEQSFTGVAENIESGEILGLYILHPNNIGRCGHISNASYAVTSSARGLHIGEQLVKHSLAKGKELGFTLLQFNAVVKTNIHAIHLYERLGFVKLGIIPKGFLMKDNSYEDIVLFYHELNYAFN
jgi:ribosomal protein S18 acetylase RimI-like enzyme